ncbi:hypothetical protein M3231_00405 [Neobacillus mesonae]|nr:hypothetical protein [Neobacillus mesonae]
MPMKPYSFMFWGLLFVMIPIAAGSGNIRYDILPDIIGYGLFAIGLHQLRHEHEHFQKAKNLNWYLLALSVFNVVESSSINVRMGEGSESTTINFFMVIINIAQLILLLRMIYRLLEGIQEIAVAKDKRGIMYLAQNRWNQFLVFNIVSLSAFIFVFIPFVNILLVFALFVWMIIITVQMMSFMRKCGKLL